MKNKNMFTRRKFIFSTMIGASSIFIPKVVYGLDVKEISFAELYPVPFWKKDWFTPAVMVGTFIATAALLYFTAGAGAPAAAPGVSTIASWIAGGGPGSYMAGLSIVGSWFGGNAILGAAILNSLSLTFGAGAVGKGALSLGTALVSIVNKSLIGVELLSTLNEKDKNNDGIILKIKVPYDLGSERVKKHILEPLKKLDEEISDTQEHIYELKDKICKEKDISKQSNLKTSIEILNTVLKILFNRKEEIFNNSVNLLESYISLYKNSTFYLSSSDFEDILVLGILAYNSGKIDLFEEALQVIINKYISKRNIKKVSFIDYLNGLLHLSKGDYIGAENFFLQSLSQEPYVVETGIGLIISMSRDYKLNKWRIDRVVKSIEEKYDDDNYEGKNISTLYFHMGTTALINKDYDYALKNFKKAYDSLGFLAKHLPMDSLNEVRNFFQMPIAITYKLMGKENEGRKILKEILERCEDYACREECRRKYELWFEHAEDRIKI